MAFGNRLISTSAALGPPEIGQYREGGIVFYINEPEGFGYVVSLDTVQKQYGTRTPVWYYQSNGFRSTSITASESNTANAGAFMGITNNLNIFYWAYNYTKDGFSDWVIPSVNLLFEYYYNRAIVDPAITANGGMPRTTGGYMVSNLYDETALYPISWVSGSTYRRLITQNTFQTRFVRKFTY